MLRAIAFGFGLLLLVGAVALVLVFPVAWPGSAELGAGGVVVLASLLLERRYRAAKMPPGAAWPPSGERFIDPGSGKLIEVRTNPQTGERAYLEIAAPR